MTEFSRPIDNLGIEDPVKRQQKLEGDLVADLMQLYLSGSHKNEEIMRIINKINPEAANNLDENRVIKGKKNNYDKLKKSTADKLVVVAQEYSRSNEKYGENGFEEIISLARFLDPKNERLAAIDLLSGFLDVNPTNFQVLE